jgi:hypothetical protein
MLIFEAIHFHRGHNGAQKPVRKIINRVHYYSILKSKFIQQFSNLRETLLSRERRSKEGKMRSLREELSLSKGDVTSSTRHIRYWYV